MAQDQIGVFMQMLSKQLDIKPKDIFAKIVKKKAERVGDKVFLTYVRDFDNNIDEKYTYKDIEKIALGHLKQIEIKLKTAKRFIFIDTYLIIIKVWFIEIYNGCPGWINSELKNSTIDMFLLCDTDIKWVKDFVRENAGKKRNYLFNLYKKELEYYNFNYKIIN